MKQGVDMKLFNIQGMRNLTYDHSKAGQIMQGKNKSSLGAYPGKNQ